MSPLRLRTSTESARCFSPRRCTSTFGATPCGMSFASTRTIGSPLSDPVENPFNSQPHHPIEPPFKHATAAIEQSMNCLALSATTGPVSFTVGRFRKSMRRRYDGTEIEIAGPGTVWSLCGDLRHQSPHAKGGSLARLVELVAPHHFDDVRQFVAEYSRVRRPGGNISPDASMSAAKHAGNLLLDVDAPGSVRPTVRSVQGNCISGSPIRIVAPYLILSHSHKSW